MIVVVLLTLVLIGLRLWGETNSIYKACAHCFVGGLTGYAIGIHNWIIITCAVLLCVAEGYMVAVRFFPNIALGNILKKKV